MNQEKSDKKRLSQKPLDKTDLWLRENWPIIWRTRIHYVLAMAILATIVLALAGFIYSSYQNDNSDLLVDPVTPIRFWTESYFQVSLLFVGLFYAYWFSLEHKRTNLVLNLRSTLLTFFAYFIGVAFLFIFCTNAFHTGIVYEHAFHKMDTTDVNFVKDNQYFLFGELAKEGETWEEGEKAFYEVFNTEQVLLNNRYDSLYLAKWSSLNDRNKRPTFKDQTFLSFWVYSSFEDYQKDEYKPVKSYMSYRSKRSPLIYRANFSDLSYLSNLPETSFSQLINTSPKLKYEARISALQQDTRKQPTSNFQKSFAELITIFKNDEQIINKEFLSSDTISIKIKKKIEDHLLFIKDKLLKIERVLSYIQFYNTKKLSIFDQRKSLSNYYTKTNNDKPKDGYVQSYSNSFYYFAPPRVSEIEKRVRSIEHARLFWKAGIYLQMFWNLLPYVIILSLGLLLAPFFNLEYSFKSLFGVSAILFLLYLISSETIGIENFKAEGSPFSHYYLYVLGLGLLLLCIFFFLKKNTVYTQYTLHSLVLLCIAATIFSIYQFDYTLQRGIQDFTDLRAMIELDQTTPSTLLFIPSKIQFWWIVGLATLIAFLGALLGAIPKRRL